MGTRGRPALSPLSTFSQGTQWALGPPRVSSNTFRYSVAAPKAATSYSGQAAKAEVMGAVAARGFHLTTLGATRRKLRSDYGKDRF